VRKKISAFSQTHSRVWCFENLGTQAYFSLMKHAAAMVGNSSSGIIESASLRLPVVNIGSRQAGRIRAANVIDVDYGHEEIQNGIRKAIAPAFGETLRTLQNPYGDGHATERIVECLKTIKLDERLLVKRFFDVSLVARPEAEGIK
jgi:UDP-N-acetylglucosamine 2-epimerase